MGKCSKAKKAGKAKAPKFECGKCGTKAKDKKHVCKPKKLKKS